MGRTITCDVCRKPTPRIVAKLFLSPVNHTTTKKSAHNNYTHHLDVGPCCADKLKGAFSWTKRLTAQEYRERGKKTT